MKGEKGNIPSTPFTPIASTILWVSLNGTFSGISNVLPCPISLYYIPQSTIEKGEEGKMERRLTLSKRQFKSTWTVSPVNESNRIFSPCRSPNLSSVLFFYAFPDDWGCQRHKKTHPRT